MTSAESHHQMDSQCVLILAPTTKDGDLLSAVLGDLAVHSYVCRDLSDLRARASADAGIAMVAQEYLTSDGYQQLSQMLSDQPAWSDFPLIVLLLPGVHSTGVLNRLQALGNVTLVTRPVRIPAFISTIRAKLRDRARQYAVRDLLSDRAAANARMRRNERRLSMALKSGGMAVWEWRRKSVYWSPGLYDLLGIDKSTPPSMENLFACAHPEDRPRLYASWQRTLRKHVTHDHEFRIIRPDGSLRWLATIGEPILNPSNRIVLVSGLISDVTDRKVSELREKRAADMERYLSEASLVLFSTLDSEETLKRIAHLCVPVFADWAILDLRQSDGSVRCAKVAHRAPDHRDLAARLARLAEGPQQDGPPTAHDLADAPPGIVPEFGKEMFRRTARNPHHAQMLRAIGPVSVLVVPLEIRGEALGSLTLATCDPMRRYRPDDLKIVEEVAHRASIAVDNARLYEAGQQASAAKSQFVANMSHEIRTPMTAVLGYTDLLEARETDPEKLDFLHTIKRNGHFLLDIINDILDLSKIEAGKMEIAREWFSIDDVIADVRSMMRIRASEKHLDFAVQFDGNVPRRIESDPKRLRQILVNLVGNAIKFTERGSVRLTVGFTEDEGRPRVRFDVVDTGIGLSEDQQSRLFQPFSQGDSSVTRSFGGTGLGLAISRRLAGMLGGEINVISHQGDGSVFSCVIDVGDVDRSDLHDTLLDAPVDSPRVDRAVYDLDCRVLVVDDRRDVRFLTRHLLVKSGAEVEFATDGLEAIEIIKQHINGEPYFDLVLLDMQMPRMDGYETAARLREMGFRQPIIALTADAMHGDMSRCLENGCDAYLSKPINRDELLRMVARHVSTDRHQ